ncbi:MAG: exodeoxyribonuclease VII large subunit [Candidatus Baltobacteraceae bacterium]
MQESLFNKHNALRAGPPAPQIVEGVSRILDYLRRLIAANKNLAARKVRGEVSGLTNSNGRLHFVLKENKDVLQCIVFAGDAARLVPFRDGDEIVCSGDFAVYAQRSQFQLIVKSVELAGAGAIYAELKGLEEKFRREGLFAAERKRRMPAFPTRLAVISSRDGRGMNDFLTTIQRRAAFMSVVFVETRVQGDGAEMDIAEAIDRASKLDVDVILLTRGGGSVEDLYPFNKEPVVRAIVRAKRPVMTAIGHNLDIHVSDQVADAFCETPSNAAQYFGEIGDAFCNRVERANMQLERHIRVRFTASGQQFDGAYKDFTYAAKTFISKRLHSLHLLGRRLDAHNPQKRLSKRSDMLTSLRSRLELLGKQSTAMRLQRVVQLHRRLEQSSRTALRTPQQRLELLKAHLDGANPNAPLERGYAIVTLDGKAVRDAAAVPAGAVITAQLQHGKLRARVEGSA